MNTNIEDLRIRRVVPEDREKLKAFFTKLGEDGTHFFNRNGGAERSVLAFCSGEKPERIYWAAVADTENGEEIAGISFINGTDSKIPWFGIGVAEGWKGRHLGRRLVAVAREYCEAAGCGGILLITAQDNLRGQGLYERCGFERLGVHPSGEFLYLLRFPMEQ
ncbi:MAG: GNAT family N-acetyltransferase [Ruminococcaceae bacterium]|nr:GNAT family N-acetyltransferase [Oscillospiraceae bacterium]